MNILTKDQIIDLEKVLYAECLSEDVALDVFKTILQHRIYDRLLNSAKFPIDDARLFSCFFDRTGE